MMKTTQFLTNIKFWQSSLVALLFLFSFTVNSQSIGDDLMAASNGALSTTSDDAVNGVDGQGGGCVPCGWSGAAGVNYAPTTGGHGPVHSGDRMWKTFAGNGGNGEFVNQVFTDIAAGTYTLTFYHRWTNAGNLDYSAGPGPQVTFKKSDGNSGWLDGYAAEVPQGNIGADAEWTANVHTIEVAEAGTYRMQVYKNGGTGANPNPMNGCLHLDTFSLTYDAEPAPTGDCIVDAFLVSGGGYPSEVSWSVLSGDTVVASGDGYDTSVTSFGLSYGESITINLVDSYGDGWNGASLSVGGVEYTFSSGTDASFVPEDICSPDCSVEAVLLNGGGYPSEVSWSISSGDAVVASGVGSDTSTVTTFGLAEGDTYTITLTDSYGDGWNGAILSVGGVEYTFSSGSEAVFEGVCSLDPVPALELTGITDFSTGGSSGKAIHVTATADIESLAVYGLGVANNGGGTDGEEYVFEDIAVANGANILVAREPDVMLAYLANTSATPLFDHVLLASSSISQNGDDAIELYFNGSVIEVYGDIDVDGTGEPWEYLDSWAYKVDGAWTVGGIDCTDDTATSCESSCPYPLIADFCPFVPVVIDGAACLDFEGDSATDGWRFQDLGGADSDWQLDTPALNGDNSLGHGYIPSSVLFQDIAVSPTFNTSAMTDAQLRYSEYMNWSSFGDTNYVMYTLDDPATLDPATASVVILDGPGVNAAAEDTWVEKVFDLPEAEQVTLLFYYIGQNAHDWNIDDVCVEEVPPPPFHDVTFNVDARNIIVHDRGMYMGGGVLGGSDAVPMSDDDGDGIWTATLNLQEGTTGEWIFLNSPGDGGDWGTKENLEGQPCATGQYNDRAVPAFDADNLVFNYCFGVCNDTNSFCAEQAVRHDVTFTVGTADLEVGENGMFVGGGLMGGSNGHAMVDNGDDTHSVTISIPEGTAGNYAFFNSPNNHYDWGTKENLEGQECADVDNYNDRYLDAVTEAGAVSFCFGTCDAECVVEEPCEFSIVLTDLFGDGWNGNSLDVLVNGEVVLDDIATQNEDDSNPVTFTFAVVTGDVIDVVYDDSGTWDGENSYVVYNNQGEEIAAESGAGGSFGDAGPADTLGLAAICAGPQNFVTADPNNAWVGYMEVFEVNADGGAGNFVFGQPWGVEDLQTVLQPDVPNILLYPNFNAYNAEDPFWSNGEMGNKIMRATTQVESWDMYNGAGLTFTGSVAEHTLEGYETVYFIKCLDPDAGYSDMLEAAYVLPLPDSGEFSVSVSGDLLPEGKLVQFGFSVIGLNANPAFDYGKVVIGDIGLSIGENDSLDMVIYPNPVDGDYVTIQTPLNGDKLVEVFDINGRKVMERLLTTDTLNVGSISAGMYIVKVTVEGQSNVSKLIVE